MTENSLTNENFPFSDLVEKITKCAVTVHKRLGDGFHEVVYKKPLALEFFFQNLSYENEIQLPFNNGEQLETSSVDFIVDEKILVEVKSMYQIGNEQLTRSLNNLKACNLEIGLLINFGNKCLEVKRVMNNPLDFQANEINIWKLT